MMFSEFKYIILFAVLFVLQTVHAQNNYEESVNYSKAKELFCSDNYLDASEYLIDEITIHPDNGYAYLLLSEINLNLKDGNNAIDNASEALNYLPSEDSYSISYAHMLRAIAYHCIAENDMANIDFNNAVEFSPNHTVFYEARGLFYNEIGEYDLSDSDYMKILALDSDNTVAQIGLGRNNYARGKYSDALQIFDGIVLAFPESYLALVLRAETYWKLGNLEYALNDAVNSLSLEHGLEAFNLIKHISESSLEKVHNIISEKISESPDDSYWPYCLGAVYDTLQKRNEAILYYRRSFDLLKDATTAWNIANLFFEIGDYGSAYEYVGYSLDIDPDNVLYIDGKANILWLLGQLQEAIEEESLCIEKSPDNSLFYCKRGLYEELNGEYAKAQEDYTQAIMLNNDYKYAYYRRGHLYFKNGFIDLATKDFETVICQDETHDLVSYAGYAYFFLNRHAEVMDFLTRILECEDKYCYDAARLYSLMNMKDNALLYLEKALENGAASYYNIIHDEYLDNIIATDEFDNIISKYFTFIEIGGIGKWIYKNSIENSFKNIYENYTENFAKNLPGQLSVKYYNVPYTFIYGMKMLDCIVNDLPARITYDSESNAVKMTVTQANYLYNCHYFDLSSVRISSAASDNDTIIQEGSVIIFDSLIIGNFILRNIVAKVVSDDYAPFSIGKGALGTGLTVSDDGEKLLLKQITINN